MENGDPNGQRIEQNMRAGQNPAKSVKEVAIPARITVAVLNYIPFLGGYFAEMLSVLKTCLNSIRETADLPYDLLVFDNGSCDEVCQYLEDEKNAGRIQYLILSEKNLGKGGAWNMMLAGAPGEMIAYTDNDCIFYPGWLSASVKILETFPNVGMVTARPFRTPPEFYSETVAWAENNSDAKVEYGDFVPFEVLHEFNLSLGQSDEFSRQNIRNSRDVRLTYHGLSAFAGGSHWQFTAYKQVLQQFLPFQMNRPMGQVRQLDQRVNEAHLLRLMTEQPYAMNLSNTLVPAKVKNEKVKHEVKISLRKRFFSLPFVKYPLLSLHDRIFKIYFRDDIKG